jgi:periplasmic divalent cation tolerance protein
MAGEFIQVVTTTSTQDEARAIAAALIEQRLAACVQIVGPIESIYRWQAKVETAAEWQCWIKTRSELFAQLEQQIRQLHSYEVPEILAIPVIDGNQSYLKWLQAETS